VKYLEQPLGGFLDSVVSGEPAPGGAAVEVLVRINTAEDQHRGGGTFDDRLGRASELAARAGGAARRAVEGEG
jgi:hypothetical protein